MNYQEALAYIYSFTDYEKTPVPHAAANYDLRRMDELLAYFDNPHLKTKSVHVTGTKGKGSTAVMIASVLTAAGYRTGLYTSPHLLTLRERIRTGRELISEAELVDIVSKIKPAAEEVNRRATYGKLTTFEILTTLAFIYFAEKDAGFQVLEVGMGGTYDATNVIKNPEVCVITPVSYDHTEVLGDTIAMIAGEKSGIIKPGCVVVASPQQPEAMEVIRHRCIKQNAVLIQVGSDVKWRLEHREINHQTFMVGGRLGSHEIAIPLLGEHQLINAATAIAAIEVLMERGFKISEKSVIQGMSEVEWPGRFQIIRHYPTVVLDGAHNADSALKLRQTLEQYFNFQKAILIIGASSDKDIAGIAREMAPVAGRVIATRSRNPRAMAPERIKTEFAKYNIEVEVSPDVSSALSGAVIMAGDNGLVCVTGSMFVVAEALEISKSGQSGQVSE
ncbi:MAG: bifunctional folylpolyglutamate synthase/dihydrofolate synthase [Dehalococcoidales bacterium]|nr:bifunctional folylpolyglutamate synthase/dihydrofolate synthase [Dehalococcoidales bacterium]